MAKIRIGLPLIENLLFAYSPAPVRVSSVGVDPDGCPFFTIAGADVPDVSEVTALCTVETNRAGQRLVKMIFEPLK